MIEIYLDQTRYKDFVYIEDHFSSHDIISTSKEHLVEIMHMFGTKYGNIQSCYDALINHIGRFVREYGENWAGEEVAIYARGYKDASYKRYYFKENGQLENWSYGFFG